MPRMLFIRLNAIDDDNVEEARASIYGPDREELPPGRWNVMYDDDRPGEIMDQEEMPYHWQEQIKRWKQWADRELSDLG